MSHPWWCETLLCTVLKQYGAHRGLLGRVVEELVLVEVWVEQRPGCPAFVGRHDQPSPPVADLSPVGAESLAKWTDYLALVVGEWNRARGA